MLRYLLDEQISHVIAEQLSGKHPEILAASIHTWRGGEFRGKDDRVILEAAAPAFLTLVTYDVSTITPLLVQMGYDGATHSGVIFVRKTTVPPEMIGLLVRSLAHFWHTHASKDWTNRTAYLTRPSP